MGYDINVSIIAVCPSCGNDLPSNSYFTSSLGRDDNPYERKDRRVFITPCADCFEWKDRAALAKANGEGV